VVVTTWEDDEGLISDLAETFDNLRKFKMKLNLDKCTFGVPSGKLLKCDRNTSEMRGPDSRIQIG
jgi:hypothetical protein